jgi:hypothetical protein
MPNGQDFSNIGLDIRTWGGAVDAANNPLNNLSLVRLNPAALPSVPSAGSFVYDSADANLKFYNGSGWFVVGGANQPPHWYVGSGPPAGGSGLTGDMYLNSANGDVYGPKTTVWGGPALNIRGPQGIQGVQGNTGPQGSQGVKGDTGNTGAQGPQGNQGIQGIQGVQGNTGYAPQYLLGSGAPSNGLGNNGDMYINSATSDVYGPKAASVWTGIVCNIKGAPGIQGVKGDTGNTGAQGIQGVKGDIGNTGAQGVQGIQGNTGTTGNPGYSPLYIVAAGAPAGGTGNNGDMYLNSTTSDVYGPKAGGAWGAIVANIKGATGNTGATGTTAVWLSGAGVPSSGLGNNGDMYLNSTTGDVYGPKAAGAWGAIVKNLVGPPGTGMSDPGSNGIMYRSALNTSAVATAAQIEAALGFTDIATGNVSTSAHGLMPKLANDATKFLNGVGSWVTLFSNGLLELPMVGTGNVTAGAYYSGGWKYRAASAAAQITFSGGDIQFNTAVAGAQDATASFSTRATIQNGGGSAITTGIKGDLKVDFNCTVTAWTLLADQSGSVVVNVWKVAQASYPATSGNKITASAPPTVSSATYATSSTLTGWTTSIAAGDCLRFNVDSITTCTRAVLILKVTKT